MTLRPSPIRRTTLPIPWAGIVLIGVFVIAAALSFIWTPYDVTALNIADRLAPPSFSHLMGANHLGRDVFSMIMVGARTSIAVSFFAVGIGVVIGAPLGLAAAAFRGPLDDALMRLADIIFAFPAIMIAILIAAVFGPSAMNAVIAIGVFNIPVFARLVRGAALPLWTRAFVLSAKTSGKGRLRISVEHILPNVLHLLIVQATIQLSIGVLAESGLAYVGLGAQPPAPSWGRMLAESQTMVAFAPWLTVFPGLAIFSFVLGLNLIGDDLRRRLDPRDPGNA